MKYSLIALFSLMSLSSFAVYDGQSYAPDENHLPGYKSPALQKQAQEERPHHLKSRSRPIDRADAASSELGSKVGPNPEAVDQPTAPKDRLHD